MKPIKAIILAGGIGKRLWPISLDKSLIPFMDKPIVGWVIDDLIKAGIKEFIFVVNPQNKFAFNQLIKLKHISGQVVEQDKTLGMAKALLCTENFIKDSPILILNSSDLLDPGVFGDFIKQIDRGKINLAGLEIKQYLEGGYFKLKGNQVVGLIEKPGAGNEPSKFFNLVIDYFPDPQLFIDTIKQTHTSKDDLYEVALDKLVGSQTIKVVKIASDFQQIKLPWHILSMMEMIFTNRIEKKLDKNSEISSGALIDGPVCIEKGVKIMAGAIIKGPVFIGENSIIGNNTLVRQSMIGKNCVVGFGSEICRSWIGDNAWFHCNYIGDSVIQGNCNFGSGARTANFRFDVQTIKIHRDNKVFDSKRKKFGIIAGNGIKAGINCSLMPGVLLGKNSWIGPGIVLKRNTNEEEKILEYCIKDL